MRVFLQPVLFLVLVLVICHKIQAFVPAPQEIALPNHSQSALNVKKQGASGWDRRELLVRGFAGVLVPSELFLPRVASAAAGGDFSTVFSKIKEARGQLDAVPDLIKAEKWDSVRAVLIQPPLSDCWTKSASARPILQQYAAAVGELPDGDELAALEAREEAITHLRFLDMAVYNNVFNPIKTEGKSGATKELIRSYYEDPLNELKACVAAFDDLVKLGS